MSRNNKKALEHVDEVLRQNAAILKMNAELIRYAMNPRMEISADNFSVNWPTK